MSLADLVHADFEPHVGTDFVLAGDDAASLPPFTLISAVALRESPRPDMRGQFRLTFRVETQDVWAQGTYRLTHPAMGMLDIFLVPAGRDDAGVEYCATFS